MTVSTEGEGPARAALALRPLEFGEILDQAVELYRRNLATFLGIYAVAALPYTLLSAVVAAPLARTRPGGLPSLGALGASVGIYLVYSIVVSPVVTGALTIAVSERFLGRPATIGSAYRQVGRQWLPLVVTSGLLTIPFLLGLLAVMVAAVLLVMLPPLLLGWSDNQAHLTLLATIAAVPAVGLAMLLFFVAFGFVPAAVVLESRGYRAIGRAVGLVRGRFWRLTGLYLVLFLMVFLAGAYVRLPSQLLAGTAGLAGAAETAGLGGVAMQLGMLLVDPLRMVGMTLAYYDTRVRGEGFDLALLAAEMEAGQAGRVAS